MSLLQANYKIKLLKLASETMYFMDTIFSRHLHILIIYDRPEEGLILKRNVTQINNSFFVVHTPNLSFNNLYNLEKSISTCFSLFLTKKFFFCKFSFIILFISLLIG